MYIINDYDFIDEIHTIAYYHPSICPSINPSIHLSIYSDIHMIATCANPYLLDTHAYKNINYNGYQLKDTKLSTVSKSSAEAMFACQFASCPPQVTFAHHELVHMPLPILHLLHPLRASWCSHPSNSIQSCRATVSWFRVIKVHLSNSHK